MDIHVNGPGALAAVNAVFGEDVSEGPARPAPAILAQFIADWPGHVDDFVEVGLEPPPNFLQGQEAAIGGFKLRFHRCQIIAGGKLIGHALRMSALDLATLAAYEIAWATYRRRAH